MPELPEVETVRRGLAALITGATIERITLHRADLRAVIPATLSTTFAGRAVTAVKRRAKYLLIDCAGPQLLCHLGMTGSWRLGAGAGRAHDHVTMTLTDGRTLVFNDPRRFGRLDVVAADGRHPALDDLGPEPLSADFTATALKTALAGKRVAIKAAIMDQRVVVGVGNIYAAEALFRAGIDPRAAAGRVSMARVAVLVEHIVNVLTAAIAAGGSTISDFRHAGGESGWFQHDFRVYGRGSQPCVVCATMLRSAVIAGRASVWCPRCQRR